MEMCQNEKLFSDPQFHGMVLEFARCPGDDLAIKMLAGMEAMNLGALCDDIAKLECPACRGGKDTRHLCEINHGTNIEIFHGQV